MGLSQASAIVVFEDNFDAETVALNKVSLTNWTISDGTVDVIGPGLYDLVPGNGNYLDMDGSTGNAGKITSTLLNLVSGSYSLSYYLAGNQRNGADEEVDVAVEVGVASTSHSLTQSDGFQQFFLNFSLVADQQVSISFEGEGHDNIGMLLDNVKLERRGVPDAGTTAGLLGLSLIGLAALRKRSK